MLTRRIVRVLQLPQPLIFDFAGRVCHIVKRPTNAILFSTTFPSLAPILARIARESSPGSAKVSLLVVAMTQLPIF